MFRRPNAVVLSLWLAVPALALAEDLPPEELARIKHEQQEALDKVRAAHGNKKSSEMDNAERQQLMQEEQGAKLGVLDKHGVSSKEHARQTARMGPAGNAAVAAAEKQQAEEREAAAKKAREPKPEEAEPIVEVGAREDAESPEQIEIPVEENAPAGKDAPAEAAKTPAEPSEAR